ncbi:MAG: hypothetical protein M0R41_18395, partial [Methylobacter tundripaludum]|nr:hypothetical protein [Methylobacter tundripaludum]
PKCEPQLGKRGLYSSVGVNELALLWVLNMSDGSNTLLDIAERSGIEFSVIQESAHRLSTNKLLEKQLSPKIYSSHMKFRRRDDFDNLEIIGLKRG